MEPLPVAAARGRASATPGAAPVARGPSADDAFWRALADEAAAPYRACGRMTFEMVRGKLRHDPMFAVLLREGLLPPGARVLDLGCGRAAVAAFAHAAAERARGGVWPAALPPAPAGLVYTGFDHDASDIDRAACAWRGVPDADVTLRHSDLVSNGSLPASDRVLLLDVLHYLPPGAQAALLRRVRDALALGGVLLLRVADASQGGGYAWSRTVDRLVLRLRGHAARTWGRPLADWLLLLAGAGFAATEVARTGRSGFPNVLLRAEALA